MCRSQEWPRLRAAQREASTTNTSRIAGLSSMQQPGCRPSRTGTHLKRKRRQRCQAPRLQPSSRRTREEGPRNSRREPPWGGAPSRLPQGLARALLYKTSKPTPPALKPLKPPDYPTAVQSLGSRPTLARRTVVREAEPFCNCNLFSPSAHRKKRARLVSDKGNRQLWAPPTRTPG